MSVLNPAPKSDGVGLDGALRPVKALAVAKECEVKNLGQGEALDPDLKAVKCPCIVAYRS
jgi:hypothetical protein